VDIVASLANPSGASIRLHHGTDKTSATDIATKGVDRLKASVYGAAGEFWATIDMSAAEIFAQVNPASGTPAIFSFELLDTVLKMMLSSSPPQAQLHVQLQAIEFRPNSFQKLNSSMTGREVRSL